MSACVQSVKALTWSLIVLQAARLGSKGLQWSDLRDDPNCGMGAVLIIFVIEWPLFLLISLYLDQVVF